MYNRSFAQMQKKMPLRGECEIACNPRDESPQEEVCRCQRAQLAERVMVCLRAGAFLSLCRHIRDRSVVVQNMELMTIGGFLQELPCQVARPPSADNIGSDRRGRRGGILFLRPKEGGHRVVGFFRV